MHQATPSRFRNRPLLSYPCARRAYRLCRFGKPAHGDAYETDDCDLLSGIAHHVGALLSRELIGGTSSLG